MEMNAWLKGGVLPPMNADWRGVGVLFAWKLLNWSGA